VWPSEVAELAAPLLGWDAAHIRREVEHYRARAEAELESHRQPDDRSASAARLAAVDMRPYIVWNGATLIRHPRRGLTIMCGVGLGCGSDDVDRQKVEADIAERGLGNGDAQSTAPWYGDHSPDGPDRFGENAFLRVLKLIAVSEASEVASA
jgi:hypothetical protein